MKFDARNWTRVLILTIAAFGLSQIPIQPAQARNTKLMLPIKEVEETYEGRLDDSIELYYGDEEHPKVETKIAEHIANEKTNAFNKSDREACRWVMLSALLELQKKAKRYGADAVVNIRSYYKKKPVSDKSRYECHAGNVVAAVALKGDIVKFEDENGDDDDEDEDDDE